MLGYYSADGILGHNQTLQRWLVGKFNIDIDARRLLWTYGGQHGLSTIIHALTRPKLLYLTPAVQNPTGAQLTDSRRLEIMEICRRYKVLIIEDDVLYCPPSNRKSPLVAIAPDITIYVSSFSKYFAGGLRVGFMILPLSLKDSLQRALRASCMNISPLMVELVCRLVISNILSPSLMGFPALEGKGACHKSNIRSSHPVLVLEAYDTFHIHKTTDMRWLASFLLFYFHNMDKLSQTLK